MTYRSYTTTLPQTWTDLADVVVQLVDADDPRLQPLVLDLEHAANCPLGAADRSAPMMARRFARAHRNAGTDRLPPGLGSGLLLSDR
jgi:hypothetical protein